MTARGPGTKAVHAGLPPAERYLSFSSYYTAPELWQTLAPDVVRELGGYDPLSTHRAYIAAASGGRGVKPEGA